MLASRFLDPVVGVDIHFELTPMGVPAPFPNPFIGLTWDPGGLLVGQAMGYAMALATGTPPTGPVFINFRPATNVGTEATNSLGVPHILIPPGVSWAPMPKPPKPAFKGPPDPPGPPVMPEGDAVHIMGSQTVTIMGSSAVRMGDLAMSCAEPVRLPSSTALPIPAGSPVLIGGPPSISLQDAIGSMVRTRWIAGHLHNLLSRIKSDRLRNLLSKAVCFLTGHPVDVATGRVLTDAVDFELPGALPIRLERHYSSAWANRAGPLGHGWSHSLEQAVWPERGKIVYLDPEGREIEFDTFDFPDHQLPVGSDVYDPVSRLTLKSYGKGRYAITTHDGLRREFERLEARERSTNGSSNGASGGDAAAAHSRTFHRSRLVRERSREGAHLRYTYDDRGYLARVADPQGRHVLLEHDGHGRLIATHLPHPSEPGRFLPHNRYAYDDHGDLVHATDALGQSYSYDYRTHLLTRETNRNGLSFYFAYDGFGEDAYCVRTWGDGGIYDHLITYDKAGRVTLVKNSLGFTTSYFMNAVGLVTKVIDPLGSTTKYAYHEPSLQRASLTDPAGAATAWEYDARGNCTSITYPDGAVVRLEYDARNLPVHATDALGGEWGWSYDSEGRLIARSDPLDRRTQFHWDVYRLQALTDPAGQHTRLDYDEAGNLAALIAPDGTTTRWQYDTRGRCHTVIDPNENAQRREHDLLGRVIRVAEPDGNLRELAYDPEGNVVHAKDRDHDVRFEHQGMGRLAARLEAGTRVEFQYDTEEQLLAIVNEHGAVYRFVLDPAGNVSDEHGFDGLRRRYQRDKAGRVALILRPASATSKYGYDAAGRVTRVEHSDGALESYAYRADGQLVRAQNTATTLEFDRDPLGRITEERSGEHWVTSAYDSLGRRTVVRSSKGLEQRIRRNAMGDVVAIEARVNGESPSGPDSKPDVERPSSVPPPSSPTSRRFGDAEPRDAFRVDFERDRLGLELERRLPGGVQSRWQRDTLGRPQLQEIRVSGVTQQARQYTWETNDRLRMIIDSMSGPVHYTHDALGNLARATYADGRVDLRLPDAVGNLFKAPDRSDRKYGPAGQLLEARDERGVTRYEYDAEGNLSRKIEPNGSEWRYRWNLNGMLASVTRPDGEVVAFSYDALGRRLSKSFRGKTTCWVWDGNVPLHEWVELSEDALARDGEPLRTSFEREVAQAKRKAHLSRRSAQGPPELIYPTAEDDEAARTLRDGGIDEEPLLLEGTADSPITWLFEPESFAPLGKLVADERYSIVTDHLGTPRAMFDAHGQEAWAAEIDTYGQLHDVRGGRRACPFRFPGQFEDGETGLYYNRFRYYDPEAGAYVSQDPIGLEGGLNSLGYVQDPTSRIDPFGLSQSCESKVIVLGEGMPRVRAAVRALREQGIDARWYRAWSKNFPSSGPMAPAQLEASLSRNARWLRTKIKEGYKIMDIGEDLTRAARSPFYRVERQVLEETSYPSTTLLGY